MKRVAKKALNKIASKRLISKQECMVLLGKMDLFTCSESIENVSISDSINLSLKTKKRKTLIQRYATRQSNNTEESLNFYTFVENDFNRRKRNLSKYIIPNFVGVNGAPCYPVSKDYARQTLIVFKPWRNYPDPKEDWRGEFERFINSPNCPQAAKIPYHRAMQRHFANTEHVQPLGKEIDHSSNPINQEDQDLMELTGANIDDQDYDERLLDEMEVGKTYPWHQQLKVNLEPKKKFVLITFFFFG